ncbi:MAG: ATP-dependent endonuclease [Candidatus Gastranaerophilales bacterium]
MDKIKIKYLTKQEILISIDRLTRFKDTEIKYLRVFRDLISRHLIYPKFNRVSLDVMDYAKIKSFAQAIINSSLKSLGYELKNDFSINEKLYAYENSIFELSVECQKLLRNNIDYATCAELIDEQACINLQWLKSLKSSVEKEGLLFPVRKILLCEGITEEILLPKIAKICGYDFKDNGVYVISAGGKNQVVKYFYNFAQNLKIPIFVLLDSDAKTNFEQIKLKLRPNDRIYILENGEFEDILPNELIVKTLNYATKNISLASIEGLEEASSKVAFLKEFFKKRGTGEFKKAEFAQLVKRNINCDKYISEEIKRIIVELKNVGIVNR